jgi:hypothetical protein
MNKHIKELVGRRRFLQESAVVVVGIGSAYLAGAGPADALVAAGEDPPRQHNMLVVGQHTMFLSHLPMFDGVNDAKSRFTSPHRFQVILEATVSNAGTAAQDVYFKDRQDHASVRIYTLRPEELFVLSRLFAPESGTPRLSAFTGTVFRGHLERDGKPVPRLQDARVSVTRVVHAHEFDPRARKPDELGYILFGKGSELFAAHAIAGPPDFDHVLAVTIEGRELTTQELTQDLRVTIKDRKNVSANRLHEGQTVAGLLTIGGQPAAGTPVQLRAVREFYFEEGELFVPATFDDTAEEKKTP